MFLFNKILFIRINCLSLHPRIKPVRIMTAIQLRAELFREMSPLLDSEAAMEKVIAFVKGLVIVFEDEKMEDWKW